MANTKTKKNPAAVALGRLGGLKGGKALAAKMTVAQRKASARRAALARWSKKSKSRKMLLIMRDRSRIILP